MTVAAVLRRGIAVVKPATVRVGSTCWITCGWRAQAFRILTTVIDIQVGLSVVPKLRHAKNYTGMSALVSRFMVTLVSAGPRVRMSAYGC